MGSDETMRDDENYFVQFQSTLPAWGVTQK